MQNKKPFAIEIITIVTSLTALGLSLFIFIKDSILNQHVLRASVVSIQENIVAQNYDIEFLLLDQFTDLSITGTSLVIVAKVNDEFQFRIFDSEGIMVRDRSEKQLSCTPEEFRALKNNLENWWEKDFPVAEKEKIIKVVKSMLGYTRLRATVLLVNAGKNYETLYQASG